MSTGLSVFIAISLLLDIVAGLIIAVEDRYLLGIDKFKYFLLIIFIPILGSFFVIKRFGGNGTSQSSSNSDFHSDINYSDSGSSGGGE